MVLPDPFPTWWIEPDIIWFGKVEDQDAKLLNPWCLWLFADLLIRW